MTIADVIKRLEDYKPETPCAWDLWLPEDVEQQAAQEGIEVTPEQVAEVLEKVEKYKDATIGISWDTISAHLDDYKMVGAGCEEAEADA